MEIVRHHLFLEEEKKNIFLFSIDLTENILRCHVWGRGSQPEIDPVVMSNTLLQAFIFALADYVTEYKLLPTLYNSPRHGSFEPPPSPRMINPGKFSEESSKSSVLLLDF